MGQLLNNLARASEQWAMLRADPGLIPELGINAGLFGFKALPLKLDRG